MRYWLVLLMVALLNHSSIGQTIPLFTHHFSNPYIYNPAYAGIEGRPTLTITHRRQWIGIDDAPVTSNVTFHTPIIGGFNLGFNVTQDEFGVFRTNSALISLGYTVTLGYRQYFSFGLSGGGKFQNIDFTNVNVNDPALIGILDNSTALDGNAGIAYHIAGFSIGFSLQNIFETDVFPTDIFDTGTLGLVRNYMITADYMFYFGNDEYIFQPMGSYKSFEGFDSQFEAGGIIHIKHLLYVGGTFRQDFGIIGLAGFKLNKTLMLGYAYENPQSKAAGINKASHEVQLTLSFGKKKKKAKKHATFLASQMPEKAEKNKKEPVTNEVEDNEPDEVEEKPEETPVIAKPDTLQRDTTLIRTRTEPEIEEKPVENDAEVVDADSVDTTEIRAELKPALVARKGNHPFELNAGHYVVVGAFGVMENAVRLNDRLHVQGYDSDFGYNSDKKLFYVYFQTEDTAEGARRKRDELRKLRFFSKAWYLLVNE